MAILEALHLKKYYQTNENTIKAVDDVNISVDTADFIAIVGTSGSGKTTLLHMLGGLEIPTDGKVLINGTDIFSLKDDELIKFRRKNIGLVFQNYNLINTMSVEENIKLPVLLDGGKIEKSYYGELIEILGLENKLKKYPNSLSGGEQQRVAIARALIMKPHILLADEPTGNLDSKNSDYVVGLLKKSNEQLKQTVIVITHDMNVAKKADYILKIEDGHIINA